MVHLGNMVTNQHPCIKKAGLALPANPASYRLHKLINTCAIEFQSSTRFGGGQRENAMEPDVEKVQELPVKVRVKTRASRSYLQAMVRYYRKKFGIENEKGEKTPSQMNVDDCFKAMGPMTNRIESDLGCTIDEHLKDLWPNKSTPPCLPFIIRNQDFEVFKSDICEAVGVDLMEVGGRRRVKKENNRRLVYGKTEYNRDKSAELESVYIESDGTFVLKFALKTKQAFEDEEKDEVEFKNITQYTRLSCKDIDGDILLFCDVKDLTFSRALCDHINSITYGTGWAAVKFHETADVVRDRLDNKALSGVEFTDRHGRYGKIRLIARDGKPLPEDDEKYKEAERGKCKSRTYLITVDHFDGDWQEKSEVTINFNVSDWKLVFGGRLSRDAYVSAIEMIFKNREDTESSVADLEEE
jgi:hypothetical protein